MASALQAAGAVAGLAGIVMVVYLYLNREIIRKKIFPMLTKKQAYRILVLLIISIFIVTVIGILAAVVPNTVIRLYEIIILGRSDSGVAYIASDPDSATIIFKGGVVGYTAKEIMLPFGDHQLILKKEGYYPETLTVPINSREKPFNSGITRLRERQEGWIKITSHMEDVTIRIGNDTLEGINETPAILGEYKEGSYLVTVTRSHDEYNTHYYQWQRSIRVERRRTTDVDYNSGTWQLKEWN